MSKYIARFITHKDYKCNHCNKLPPDFYSEDGRQKSRTPVIYQEFFLAYERFRVPWRKPISWTSGYRCLYWNKHEGGSPISIHIFGLAGDGECRDNEEMEELYQCMLEYSPEMRIGKYRQKIVDGQVIKPFIHFDIGYEIIPRLTKKWRKGARWTG